MYKHENARETMIRFDSVEIIEVPEDVPMGKGLLAQSRPTIRRRTSVDHFESTRLKKPERLDSSSDLTDRFDRIAPKDEDFMPLPLPALARQT